MVTEALPNPVWGAFEIDDEYAYHLAGDEGCALNQGTSIVRVALDNGDITPRATGLAQDDDCVPPTSQSIATRSSTLSLADGLAHPPRARSSN